MQPLATCPANTHPAACMLCEFGCCTSMPSRAETYTHCHNPSLIPATWRGCQASPVVLRRASWPRHLARLLRPARHSARLEARLDGRHRPRGTALQKARRRRAGLLNDRPNDVCTALLRGRNEMNTGIVHCSCHSHVPSPPPVPAAWLRMPLVSPLCQEHSATCPSWPLPAPQPHPCPPSQRPQNHRPAGSAGT